MIDKISRLFLVGILWLHGCSSTQLNKTAIPSQIQKQKLFAIVPFYNYTQTPMAGYRAAALANAVAAQKGFVSKTVGMDSKEGMLDETLPDRETLLKHAESSGARYMITGEVTEWRYKTGIDGEPAVGLVLHIVDLKEGKTIYTGAGSESGWGHKSISVIAQSVLEKIIP
ncbi:MAG: hypothetical protein B6D59_00755 [Campylobacteraceae bacterium 4484_4]|nr:MAG: hypothetical protein B6D59_00755 [Campylobacteraceae bacterium 4484_4]